MRRLRAIALGGALCAALSACAPDLLALQNDKNSDCITETSVWVNVRLDRNWGCEYPPPGFMLVPIPATPAAAPSPTAGAPTS